MSEIVYSREAIPLAPGQVYQNPRFFTGPIADARSVVVHGDFPDIVAAYAASGVGVVVVNAATAALTHEPAPGDFGPLAASFIAGTVADGVQPEQSDADASREEPASPVIPCTPEEDFGNVRPVPRRGAKSK